MTNRLSLILGALLISAIVADAVLFEWAYSVFLARKFADLLWWLSFWR